MIINFRQGIVSYDTSLAPFSAAASVGGVDVTLNVGTEPFVITLANQNSNYLWSEALTINAWQSLPSVGSFWLYFDFDSKTFVRTFGYTIFAPIVQANAPVSPSSGQHWYQITTHQMFVWNGSVWNPVLRVFAAKFIGPSTFISLSINAPDFRGTQIGDTTQVDAGRVLVDSSGNPIIKKDGTFFTTEDQSFAEGTAINSVRLESNVFTGQSSSASIIPVYEIVAFNQNGTIRIASYNDAGTTAIGMALQQFNFGGTGAVLLEGTVTNPNWNFSGQIGSLLWVSGDNPGTLTNVDPHISNPVIYQIARVPVARVIAPTSIIFLQGIGTKGDPGPPGSASISLATATTPGTVLLSTDGNTVAPTPVVVSEVDPRLSNARTPLAHNQAATTITVTPSGGVSSTNAQAALQELDTKKLALAGGTMTGTLLLNADPTVPLGAATKAYVDSAVGSGQFVPLAGGTMTGALILSGPPTTSLQAATKAYVDANAGTAYLAGAGLTLTGTTFSVSTGAITNPMLQNPTLIINATSGGSGALALGGTFNILGDSSQGVSTTETGGTVSGGFQVTPPTVVVSVQNAGTSSSTKGVAYFNPGQFSTSGGQVSLLGGSTSIPNTDVVFIASPTTLVTLTNVTAISRFPSATVSYIIVFVNGVLQREDNSSGNAYPVPGAFYVSSTSQLTFFANLNTSDEVIIYQI